MTKEEDDFVMREEYDFSRGIRNPYVQKFRELNLVSLDDDVKGAFPDSQSVNAALRMLMETALKMQTMRKAT